MDALHCPDDSPFFVATWYTLAIGGLTHIGASRAPACCAGRPPALFAMVSWLAVSGRVNLDSPLRARHEECDGARKPRHDMPPVTMETSLYPPVKAFLETRLHGEGRDRRLRPRRPQRGRPHCGGHLRAEDDLQPRTHPPGGRSRACGRRSGSPPASPPRARAATPTAATATSAADSASACSASPMRHGGDHRRRRHPHARTNPNRRSRLMQEHKNAAATPPSAAAPERPS